MDTTDIKIPQPLDHMAAYTTRKKVCAVKLQAVFDSSKRIIDLSCGWPGSIHDSRIYSLSAISRSISELLAHTEFHLIADKGFPLELRVMTPYRHRNNMTPVSGFSNIECVTTCRYSYQHEGIIQDIYFLHFLTGAASVQPAAQHYTEFGRARLWFIKGQMAKT